MAKRTHGHLVIFWASSLHHKGFYLKVLRITSRDTIAIRHQVLRPGRPVETCYFPGDDEDQTFHLGAFVEGKLVSVSSFFFEKHPAIEAPYQYRLRGMATLPEHQRHGYSQELLKIGFPMVKQSLCSVVWCNARKSALGFYEKLGFQRISEEFEIPEIGPHYLMLKNL
jgi:GNAT superfamily N-acetyltransferase